MNRGAGPGGDALASAASPAWLLDRHAGIPSGRVAERPRCELPRPNERSLLRTVSRDATSYDKLVRSAEHVAWSGTIARERESGESGK